MKAGSRKGNETWRGKRKEEKCKKQSMGREEAPSAAV